MYEFVGVMLGIALRTAYTLNLDLPTFVWKQLLNERPDLSDLEQIDRLFIQQINVFKRPLSAEIEQKFCTQVDLFVHSVVLCCVVYLSEPLVSVSAFFYFYLCCCCCFLSFFFLGSCRMVKNSS